MIRLELNNKNEGNPVLCSTGFLDLLCKYHTLIFTFVQFGRSYFNMLGYFVG